MCTFVITFVECGFDLLRGHCQTWNFGHKKLFLSRSIRKHALRVYIESIIIQLGYLINIDKNKRSVLWIGMAWNITAMLCNRHADLILEILKTYLVQFLLEGL